MAPLTPAVLSHPLPPCGSVVSSHDSFSLSLLLYLFFNSLKEEEEVEEEEGVEETQVELDAVVEELPS